MLDRLFVFVICCVVDTAFVYGFHALGLPWTTILIILLVSSNGALAPHIVEEARNGR